MKNIVFMIVVILFVHQGFSSETERKPALTFKDRQRIAWAIKVLEAYKVFNIDENKCVQFEPSLIEQLQNEGLLDRRGSAFMSICIGR